MEGLCVGCYFYQPMGDCDVLRVTNMRGMFRFALSFNQPIGDWDVSSVTNMDYMFESAFSFNQNISTWDVSSVNSASNFTTTASILDMSNQPKFT